MVAILQPVIYTENNAVYLLLCRTILTNYGKTHNIRTYQNILDLDHISDGKTNKTCCSCSWPKVNLLGETDKESMDGCMYKYYRIC